MKLPDTYTCPECDAGVGWQELMTLTSPSGSINIRRVNCWNCGTHREIEEGEEIKTLGENDRHRR